MSEFAREYYGELIKPMGLETDLTVHCDVFGTLLEDFSDEPILNRSLVKFLEWLDNEGFDVRIVSSDPETAKELLEKTDINDRYKHVADKRDFIEAGDASMALLIDDSPFGERRYASICDPNEDKFKQFLSVFHVNEASYKPEDVKRFLVIDDDLGRWAKVDNLFKSVTPPVEVIYAHWSGNAIEQINEWLDAGYKVDAITCDDNRLALGGGEHANEALTAVLEHIENRNPDLLPDQLFVHSKGASMRPELKWGETISIDTMELQAIASDVEYNDPLHGRSAGNRDHYSRTRLREWCNKNWGTNFILSESQAKFIRQPDKKLDTHEMMDILYNKTTDAKTAFSRLDIDSLMAGDEPNKLCGYSKESSGFFTGEIKFKDATGDAVVGRLAFDAEDIQRLKSEDMLEPITLCVNEYDPTIVSLLPHVNCVILLGEGSEHFKLVLENAGISGVLTLDHDKTRDGQSLVSEDKKLIYTRSKYDDEKGESVPDITTLNAGDAISTETEKYRTSTSNYLYDDGAWVHVTEGNFYPVKMNLTTEPEYYHGGEYADTLTNAADELRHQNSNLRLMVNADTPQQINYAVAAGAEGVGLIRSEHMFYETDRLELLQSAFLASDDGQRSSALDVLETLHSEDIALRIQSAQKSARPFPLTFRLMDAPLDEFLLPDQKDAVIARVGQANIRGVQFANQTSGLYEMQIHALRDAINKTDYSEPVRIMIPNVQTAEEVAKTKAMVFDLMDGKEFEFGVMIETLDAIENIRPIAQQCDFMSFGTNDLTAEVMGNVNRVDYDAISKWMMDNDVQGETPFKQLIPQVLDQMQIATDGARDVNPDIHISACGHQLAIDPKAPKIALSMGFNAVSVPNMKFYAMRLMSAYHANICTMPTTKVAVVVDNSSSPDSLTL
jgi:hypothetical protein